MSSSSMSPSISKPSAAPELTAVTEHPSLLDPQDNILVNTKSRKYSEPSDDAVEAISTEPTFQEKVHSLFQTLGLPTWITQLFLFGLIGASGIFVDLAVVVLCREGLGLAVDIGIYPAFLVAVTWNFELNRRITFDSRNVNWLYSYVMFFLACTLGLAVRVVFIKSAKSIGFDDSFLRLGTWEIPYLRLSYIAYVGGIIIAYVINFLGSKFVAFRTKEASTTSVESQGL